MAKVIEFYVPNNFRRKVKWLSRNKEESLSSSLLGARVVGKLNPRRSWENCVANRRWRGSHFAAKVALRGTKLIPRSSKASEAEKFGGGRVV